MADHVGQGLGDRGVELLGRFGREPRVDLTADAQARREPEPVGRPVDEVDEAEADAVAADVVVLEGEDRGAQVADGVVELVDDLARPRARPRRVAAATPRPAAPGRRRRCVGSPGRADSRAMRSRSPRISSRSLSARASVKARARAAWYPNDSSSGTSSGSNGARPAYRDRLNVPWTPSPTWRAMASMGPTPRVTTRGSSGRDRERSGSWRSRPRGTGRRARCRRSGGARRWPTPTARRPPP